MGAQERLTVFALGASDRGRASISTENTGDNPAQGRLPQEAFLDSCLGWASMHRHTDCIPPGCEYLWSSVPWITGAIASPQPWAGNISSPSESRLQQGADGAHLKLLQGDRALSDELVRVLLQHGHLSVDLLIHERLREHGLVHLVVATPAITDLQGRGWVPRPRQCG